MHRGWSGLLPAGLLVASAGILALSALSLPRRPYTGVMLRSDHVAGVVQGSPGERAGVLAGDRLRPAHPPSGGPATRLGPLSGATPGAPLELERRADGGAWRRVWLVPDEQPAVERRMMAAQLAVCSGFVLLAGAVWSERRDHLTRTFFLLCLAFAWLVMPTPLWPSAVASAAWEAAYSGITLFLPALFIHFFALFPEGGPRSRGVGLVVRGAYLIATLLFAAAFLELAAPQGASAAARTAMIETAAAVWFAAGLAFALALFGRSYFRARSPDARRRLRVALAGTVLGAGPLAILILVRNLSPGTAVPGERWAVVATLLVPASFAWAVVVHRIFDFRVALRAIGVGLGLLVIAGSAWLSGEWIARHWGSRLGAEVEGMSLAGIALLSAVLGPVGTWARSFDARFARDAGAASLGAWVARDEPAGDDAVERILGNACQALLDALRLDGCCAVVPAGGGMREVARIGHLSPLAPDLGLIARLEGESGVVAGDDPRLQSFSGPLEHAGIQWVLPVGRAPMRALLLLGRRLSGTWLGRIEVRELMRFADHADVALENAELRQAARSRGALERELEVAHAMQVNLLPRRAPVYPTLDCAATAVSSESVGGDYYDFVETSARDFTLAVGDAAGKGVPAALVLARVQAHFRDEARRAGSPGALLRALNRELVGLDQPEKFMGLLCARVEVRMARVWFANAGLTPPLVRRRGGRFEELTAGGVLLGVSGDATYPDVGVELSAGDVVVLYTDGLTEARRGDEMFGVERVRQSLESAGGRRAADILEDLLTAVRDFADRPLDDLTVVVLRQLTEPARGRNPLSQIALKLRTAAADPTR
jgi:serine phosphatase RsbU (regulator of sigma subunit)